MEVTTIKITEIRLPESVTDKEYPEYVLREMASENT